jgi:hypothetical protein
MQLTGVLPNPVLKVIQPRSVDSSANKLTATQRPAISRNMSWGEPFTTPIPIPLTDPYAARARPSQSQRPPTAIHPTLVRLLDAAVHLHVHAKWHNSPSASIPTRTNATSPASARPAQVRQTIRHRQSPLARHLTPRPSNFKDSPNRLTLGQAFASRPHPPLAPYRQLDIAIITLWPLLKRHNWTYRDLLNVIHTIITRPKAYPCQREQDFTVHCRHRPRPPQNRPRQNH